MQTHKQALLWVLIIVVVIAVTLYIVIARREGGAPAAGGEGTLEDLSGALNAVPDVSAFVTPADPLENLPDVNPVEQANPFSDLNTNPFR